MPQESKPKRSVVPGLELLQEGTRKTLDRHGYTFQHKVIDEIRAASEQYGIGWKFEASEFPAAVSNHSTRIDAIFSRGEQAQRSCLVLECKRADPAKSAWCFIAAPTRSRGRALSGQVEYLYFSWREPGSSRLICARGVEAVMPSPIYDLGFEVKRQDVEGDKSGTSRKAIDDACFQLALGCNGLVEHFSRLVSNTSQFEMHLKLFPVLVTTAQLYSSAVDLTRSAVATGELDVDQLVLKPEKWVVFRYPQDPRILHTFSPLSPARSELAARHDPQSHDNPFGFFELGRDLDTHYVRTIPIVSAAHITEFIKAFAR